MVQTSFSLFRTLILIACTSYVSSSLAITPAELLEQSTRPTLAEFREAYPTLPERPPYINTDGDIELLLSLQATLFTKVPAVIAAFEYFYPGGTYAALGRDAVLTGDVLDSFYRSQGETDRIVRLDASGTSVDNTNLSVLQSFLESSGLDVDRAINEAPYVIFDATNYSPQSQSSRLMKAVYELVSQHGYSPNQAVRKLNFIDVKKSMKFNFLEKPFDREHYFSNISPYSKARPSEIVSIHLQDLTYSRAWHDTFGRFQKQPEGTVKAFPGSIGLLSDRRRILNELWMIERITSTSEFHQEVARQAALLGYQFPEKRQWQGLTPQREAGPRLTAITDEFLMKRVLDLAERCHLGESELESKAVGTYLVNLHSARMSRFVQADDASLNPYLKRLYAFLVSANRTGVLSSTDLKKISSVTLSKLRTLNETGSSAQYRDGTKIPDFNPSDAPYSQFYLLQGRRAALAGKQPGTFAIGEELLMQILDASLAEIRSQKGEAPLLVPNTETKRGLYYVFQIVAKITNDEASLRSGLARLVALYRQKKISLLIYADLLELYRASLPDQGLQDLVRPVSLTLSQLRHDVFQWIDQESMQLNPKDGNYANVTKIQANIDNLQGIKIRGVERFFLSANLAFLTDAYVRMAVFDTTTESALEGVLKNLRIGPEPLAEFSNLLSSSPRIQEGWNVLLGHFNSSEDHRLSNMMALINMNCERGLLSHSSGTGSHL